MATWTTRSRSTWLILRRAALLSAAVANAIDIAEATASGFVEHGQSVGEERRPCRTGLLRTMLDVLDGVRRFRLAETEAAVDPRPQRAILGQRESAPELGQSDEDQREQRFRVPLVVRQDVQVFQHVLTKQVRLVEEEARMNTIPSKFLDVGGHGVEDCGRRRLGRQAERDAELPVEVPAAQRGVVAIRQSKAGLR